MNPFFKSNIVYISSFFWQICNIVFYQYLIKHHKYICIPHLSNLPRVIYTKNNTGYGLVS